VGGEERRDKEDGEKVMELISTRGRDREGRAKLRGICLLKNTGKSKSPGKSSQPLHIVEVDVDACIQYERGYREVHGRLGHRRVDLRAQYIFLNSAIKGWVP
jgi:hypothetical protein